jgi:protein phosphatase
LALRIADKASLTDVGRQRHTNEDSYFEKPPVFAVADGMGGAQAGEVASAMAVKEFEEDRHAAAASPEARLAAIARTANRRIWDMARSDQQHAGMGTTLTAVMVGPTDVSVGHVGDSRLYRFRDGKLERLTRDHSLVEEFVRQGKLTPEQAERHPQRSVITRALGPESEVEVETFTIPARSGDVYLLCSDGLSGMVKDELMESIVGRSDSMTDTAKALIDAANEGGGRDNITVVIFRLEDDEATADEQATIAGQEQAPSADEIEAARVASQAPAAGTAGSRASPPGAPPAAAEARPRPAEPKRGRRRRGRVLVVALGAVAFLGLVGGGLYAGSRQVWFLGTNDDGAVTLYRGVPYELPLGFELYEQKYVSGVPAAAIPGERRQRVLDHQLRSRDDAVDLLRRLDVAASR